MKSKSHIYILYSILGLFTAWILWILATNPYNSKTTQPNDSDYLVIASESVMSNKAWQAVAT